MDSQLRRQIIIKTATEEEEARLLEKVYSQLVGNPDFVDCSIVVNDSSTRRDGTKNEIRIYIFDEAESDPEITI